METNKEVILRYVACFNQGDLQGLREVFAPDAQIHGVLGWGCLDDVAPIWEQLINGLGIQLKVEAIAVDGDNVAVRFMESGTSQAPFFDKPATGKSYQLLAMEWFVVRNGKIYRRWAARDAASQARQLGWNLPAAKEDVVFSPN